jgi:hypothetical protein
MPRECFAVTIMCVFVGIIVLGRSQNKCTQRHSKYPEKVAQFNSPISQRYYQSTQQKTFLHKVALSQLAFDDILVLVSWDVRNFSILYYEARPIAHPQFIS